jgi:pimeloyl-ACP methyl ester carboxylesterase
MADDAVGLLTHLGVDRAHIVGASMGGMIAQVIAINHPDRVLTLTSIMSNLGAEDVVPSKPEAAEALGLPQPDDREALLEQAVRVGRVMAGAHPIDEELTRRNAAAAYDRAFYPAGRARQFAAVLAAPSRREALGRLDVPALVLHGVDDPLVVLENGRRTAAALRHVRLLEIQGMGHNYPEHTWEPIADAIADLAADR